MLARLFKGTINIFAKYQLVIFYSSYYHSLVVNHMYPSVFSICMRLVAWSDEFLFKKLLQMTSTNLQAIKIGRYHHLLRLNVEVVICLLLSISFSLF